MIVNFIKASPAQNTTILVTSYCPPEYYRKVARTAIGYEYLYGEQVGFLVPPRGQDSVLRLEMSGGGFCGNGTLAAAAYAQFSGITSEEAFYIDVSGTDRALSCSVKKLTHFKYYASATMPPVRKYQKLDIFLEQETLTGYLIELEGIAHFIVETGPDFALYEQTMEALKAETMAEAIGLVPFQTLGDEIYKIKPYVHVRKTGTDIFERGCGSGSCALGVHLQETASIDGEITVRQPGGVIKVKTGTAPVISTEVLFTCEGKIMI